MEGRPGSGDRAGDRPWRRDYYETGRSTLEELIEIMFEDLELPNLERRALREIQSDYSSRRKGYRKVGIRIRLDKRRTAKQRVIRMLASDKRNSAAERALAASQADRDADAALEGSLDEIALEEGALDEESLAPETAAAFQRVKRRFPFHQDDLRYKHVEIDTKEESNAVVVCIMDTSGSMDTMKKYLARSFFFLLYQFISTRYRNVEIVFIAHHTEASEVTEEEFFHKGESGGTFISSGYAKALEIIAARYHPSLWNVYAFHCSDGDNFDSDNPAALKDAEELAVICNLFGYGEIKPLGSRYYESSYCSTCSRRIQAPNFHTAKLIERKDISGRRSRLSMAKDRVSGNHEFGSRNHHQDGNCRPKFRGWRRGVELKDLVEWDERIRAKATEFGLNCYPQEFELCDHNGMLAVTAYSGMPSHYPD